MHVSPMYSGQLLQASEAQPVDYALLLCVCVCVLCFVVLCEAEQAARAKIVTHDANLSGHMFMAYKLPLAHMTSVWLAMCR